MCDFTSLHLNLSRFPQDDCEHADNRSFRSFQANFMNNLSRKGLKPQYVAVRDQSREKHQHYHVLAEINTKGNTPKGQWKVFASWIPEEIEKNNLIYP